VADAVRKAGFEPIEASSGRDALRRLKEADEYDAIIVASDILNPDLQFLIAQLRADIDFGLVPVIVTVAGMSPAADPSSPIERPVDYQRRELAAEDRVRIGTAEYLQNRNLQQLEKKYPRVTVIPAVTDANLLKELIVARIAEDLGQPLTPAEKKDAAAAAARLKRVLAERKENADRAVIWLGRLARGEIAGYDVRPAGDSLIATLRSNSHSPEGLAAAVGRLPGAKAQLGLANLVLDLKAAPQLRSAAAFELVRHIQQHGLVLSADQTQALETLAEGKDTDPALKASVLLVLGTMRPDSRTTGERLKGFSPTPPPPPATAEPKEKQ
jgi:vacuolar-type H+-ATPase subunit F/Vma7